ncbi:helix-turn-helix transcriptional regulator [Micromonospora sp. NPDC005806]|uniref:helix-turn-helix transcriptional regulator n=1 Tax=Micromonospora sp. NPDC005806 TaxID=3364234 RepID=UPI003683A984
MDERTWVQRLAAVATLDDPVRRALYEYVTSSSEPVGRDEAAEALDLKRSTAAFHLDRLVTERLLAVEYRRLSGRSGPGAGRPAKLYRRPDSEVAVSVPERRYDLAGELLAAATEQSASSGQPVHDVLGEMAYNAGREIGATAGSLAAALDNYGFQPRPDDCDGWRLGNCPFHQLARQHTQLICGLNLQLLRGVAEGTGDDRYTMVLDPGPDRCCVHAARNPDNETSEADTTSYPRQPSTQTTGKGGIA